MKLPGVGDVAHLVGSRELRCPSIEWNNRSDQPVGSRYLRGVGGQCGTTGECHLGVVDRHSSRLIGRLLALGFHNDAVLGGEIKGLRASLMTAAILIGALLLPVHAA